MTTTALALVSVFVTLVVEGQKNKKNGIRKLLIEVVQIIEVCWLTSYAGRPDKRVLHLVNVTAKAARRHLRLDNYFCIENICQASNIFAMKYGGIH